MNAVPYTNIKKRSLYYLVAIISQKYFVKNILLTWLHTLYSYPSSVVENGS